MKKKNYFYKLSFLLIIALLIASIPANTFALQKAKDYIVIDVSTDKEYTFSPSQIRDLCKKEKRDINGLFFAFTAEKDGKYLISLRTDGGDAAALSFERGIPSFAVHIDPSKSDTVLVNNIKSDWPLEETSETPYVLREGKTYYFCDEGLDYSFEGFSLKISYCGSVTKEDVIIDDFKAAATQINAAKSVKKGLKLYFMNTSKYKVDGYDIYRSSTKYSVYKKIGSTTNATYVDKTARNGKRYFYKINAYRYLNGKKYEIEWNGLGHRAKYSYKK